MIATLFQRLHHLGHRVLATARARVARWTWTAPLAVAAGAAVDTTRSRSALLLENALLRHQLVVLSRAVKRPRLTAADRGLLVLLASRLRAWEGRSSSCAPRPSCAGIARGSGSSGDGSRGRDRPLSRSWRPSRSR